MDDTLPSRFGGFLFRVSAFWKLQQWEGGAAQQSWDITLVMGASIVMEWTLAMEERRRWELPVAKQSRICTLTAETRLMAGSARNS